MKSYLSIVLLLVFGLSIDAYGQLQRPTRRPNLRDQVEKDLNQIFGVCGCTNCDGRLEHSDPYEEGEEPNGFQLVGRWTSTTLSGGGLSQGTPTILTWSIVPDGTDANGGGGFVPSNLISVFDNLFNEANAGSPDLTNRFWFSLIETSLDRWGEISGLEYVYEPNDDGATNFGVGGVLGVRGDVRIGGFTIDGGGNVLAFNTFPNNGDMAIDTSDTGLFGSPAAGFRLFRNVFTHEQGHGIGFNHVLSNNANFLMEPFISGAFDGPQLDDVLAIHRHYGDVFEKSNDFQGNNSIGNATPLGTIGEGQSVTIGVDGATGTVVAGNDDDFVSVDDNNDQDFYEFTVPDLATVSMTLTPVGSNYNQSPETGNGGQLFTPSSSSNLTLALLNSSGGVVSIENAQPAGTAEVIEDFLLAPGTYFARATGTANTVQLYTLNISVEEFVAPNTTAPSSVTVSTGSIAAGGVGDLAASDDQYLELLPDVPANPGSEEISALFTLFSPDISPSSISLDFEVSGNSANLNQSISLFNNFTNQFDEFDSSSVSFNDNSLNLDPPGNPQSYTQVGSGLVLISVSFESTGPVFLYPWTIRIDELVLNSSQ